MVLVTNLNNQSMQQVNRQTWEYVTAIVAGIALIVTLYFLSKQ